MHWKTILFGIFKGLVEVLCDEYRLLARRRAARTPPKKEAPPPVPTMGWGPPSPPPPATLIRVETDEGSKVAAASFVGSEYFGQKKVEKERQPGESRRKRRKTEDDAEKYSVPMSTATPVEESALEMVNADAAPIPAVRRSIPPAGADGRTASSTRTTRRLVLDLSTATLATLARGAT